MNYKKAIADRFKRSTPSSAPAVALALVGGIALGAVVSLLFAPRSGEETRGMIADKTKDLAEGMKGKFKHVTDRFRSETAKANGHVKNDISA